MSKLETIDNLFTKLEEKNKEIAKLREEIAILTEQREWAYEKLRDAQAKIRKINWMLMQEEANNEPHP